MMADRCKSCGAQIIWAMTEHGVRMPLDPKPEKRAILVDSECKADSLRVALLRDTYISHFATCSNTQQHRKGARPA
jgi:hypothetical protein